MTKSKEEDHNPVAAEKEASRVNMASPTRMISAKGIVELPTKLREDSCAGAARPTVLRGVSTSTKS